MSENNIVLVTSTSYNPLSQSDNLRSKLALNLVAQAKEFNYPLIIIDKASSRELLEEFKRNNARVYQQSEKTMGAGRRQGFQLAYDSGKEVIVWLEPEKYDFVKYIRECGQPILTGNTDAVIPRRKSLDSYPAFQRDSEIQGNEFFEKLTGVSWDIFFGPRVFRRSLCHYFTDYNGKYGDLWDSINIPLVEMIFYRERINEVVVDFKYPQEQSEIESQSKEFIEKRKTQLERTKTCLENHWNILNSPE